LREIPPKCNPLPVGGHADGVPYSCMQTGKYATEFDKLALAVESTKVAKSLTIKEEGIGEDLNINLFCWKNDELVCIMQLRETHQMERDKRIEALTKAACIMRRGWGVDQFTFIAEAYCSMSPSDTKDQNLAELFAEPDSPVKECISFTQISSEDATFISLPYKIELGRKVTFNSPLWYAGLDVFRDLTYPATLKASLKLDPVPLDEETIDRESYFSSLASGLIDTGFEIFYRDDI